MMTRSDTTKKHILTRITAAVLCACAASATAFAENAGFRTESRLVTTAKTPYDTKYTNVQWQTEAAESIGVPVAYKDSVLLPNGSSILRLAEEDGRRLAEIKLPEAVSPHCSGVMTGDILIQPTESGLCTVDFTTGEVTSHTSLGGTTDSDTAVVDGLVFTTTKTDDGETMYLCDIDDLSVKHQFTSDSDITSPTIQGGYIIFGAGESLVTVSTEDGAVCEIPLGTAVTSAPFATEYAVFFAAGDSTAKLRLNSDGTMEEDTLTLCKTGSNTAAPVVYDSVLYTVSDSGFHIIDSLNMEITQSFSEVKSGSDPIITLGTGTRIYTVARYNDIWALYSFFHPTEEYDITCTPLAKLDDFTNGRVSVSDAGTMYYRDAYGRLFALTRVEYDILAIIIKLVLMVIIIAGVFLWMRMLAKRRADLYPKY